MVVISNTNADQQATNLEILAQRQTHGAKPWEPHTWGLWDISIIIINGNFEETYNWEAPRNCRIPSNELSYCQPAIVQRSRPTWVIWFSNMSLLGPWPRAVGPCVPCLHVKQEFMPQVGIINITTPNARLNILGISWRKKKAAACISISCYVLNHTVDPPLKRDLSHDGSLPGHHLKRSSPSEISLASPQRHQWPHALWENVRKKWENVRKWEIYIYIIYISIYPEDLSIAGKLFKRHTVQMVRYVMVPPGKPTT